MPTLALGQRRTLTFQMGHRDSGHKAKPAVFLLPYSTLQPTRCLLLFCSARFRSSTQGLNFHLISLRKAVGLYCYRCLAVIFPEAAIISANAIQWVMEEVRTVHASQPLRCYLPMTLIYEAHTLLSVFSGKIKSMSSPWFKHSAHLLPVHLKE